MLAYVFWHWPRPDVERDVYERLLADFQEALARHPSPGLIESAVFRGGPAPWVQGSLSYEDWYVTEGSGSLDPLNERAVAPPVRESHDLAARAAANGMAGLYRLRLGNGEPSRARWSLWFSKPDGVSYASLHERIRPLLGEGAGLWGRQMTLGPTTEFCLLAPAPVSLPREMSGLERPLQPVWTGRPQAAAETK